VRDAAASDLSALAQLHRRAYSRDHFLALLPEEALADYYSRFLGQGSRVVVAYRETGANSRLLAQELLGFAVYGRDIESRIAAFKRDRRRTIATVAFRHPVLAAQKALTAAGARLHGGAAHVPARALLLSIAVGQSGNGVGRMLLEDMLNHCAAAGEDRIGLYVRHRNVAAINAYLSVGFGIKKSIADQYYMERTVVAEANSREV
jgi:ribosomal protein S18 acetylase RimI-like enzyme